MVYRIARTTPARAARARKAIESLPDGRVRCHRRFIARQSTLCAVALLPLLTDRGVDGNDYGLRYPGPYQTGFTLLVPVALVLLFGWRNRIFAARARAGRPVRIPAARLNQLQSHLASRTGRDRRWGAGTALAAGICEEIVFRGLLYGAAVTLLELDPWSAALVTASLFGLGHLDQGPAGCLRTGLLGLCFTAMYASSGSLLLPIAVHVALDVVAFVLPAPVIEPLPESAPSPDARTAVPAPPVAAPAVRLRAATPDG